jgi:hypothetical protein
VTGMTTSSLADIPIRSAAELTERWSTVLAPPVFSARSLWLLWLGADGRMLPVVIPVDDVHRLPDRRLVAGLPEVHRGVAEQFLDGSGHLALALCRPGGPQITEDDASWAKELPVELDDDVNGTWSLHLAAGGHVTELVGRSHWC